MKGYVIKVTYLDGRHKGHTYFMRKGGYVIDEKNLNYLSSDDVYSTLRIAKMVCTKMYKDNERNHEFERLEKEHDKEKGREVRDWYIYERESYEPYEI